MFSVFILTHSTAQYPLTAAFYALEAQKETELFTSELAFMSIANPLTELIFPAQRNFWLLSERSSAVISRLCVMSFVFVASLSNNIQLAVRQFVVSVMRAGTSRSEAAVLRQKRVTFEVTSVNYKFKRRSFLEMSERRAEQI